MRPRPAAVLQLFAPDGSAAKAENGSIGRYRSTFDLHLTQKGTYKLAIANNGLFASWKEGQENKRWMGKAEDFAKQVPANAAFTLQAAEFSRSFFIPGGWPCRIFCRKRLISASLTGAWRQYRPICRTEGWKLPARSTVR